MQHHAANQLHVKVAHIEHPASRLAHHGKGFHQDFVEHFLQRFVLLFFKCFLLVKIGIVVGSRLCCLRLLGPGDAAQPLLNALAEFIRLGAQLFVAELLNLRLQRVDGLHVGHQRLDHTLVLRAKNLA